MKVKPQTPQFRKLPRWERGAQVRAFEENGEHYIEAVVLVYGVVDDYRTRFMPGCASESLGEWMPRLCWSHDWDDPIGLATIIDDNNERMIVRFRLDDFDAVPNAKRAYAQAISGTIDQYSIGFMIKPGGERLSDDSVVEYSSIFVVEASCVLRGAVPGTHTTGVRSVATEDKEGTDTADDDADATEGTEEGTVSLSLVVDLARKLAAGEIDLTEAYSLIGHTPEVVEGTVEEATIDPELAAEIDDVLEIVSVIPWD